MIKYLSINSETKKRLLLLIKFLYIEVCSSSGDGDALWYSKYYDVKEILPLIHEFNNLQQFKWQVEIKDETIYWGQGEEWITITNNGKLYETLPSWSQCSIVL